MKRFLCEDRVLIEDSSATVCGIGTVIDWYAGVKGQSIKIELDEDFVAKSGLNHCQQWFHVYDPKFTVTLLQEKV